MDFQFSLESNTGGSFQAYLCLILDTALCNRPLLPFSRAYQMRKGPNLEFNLVYLPIEMP